MNNNNVLDIPVKNFKYRTYIYRFWVKKKNNII